MELLLCGSYRTTSQKLKRKGEGAHAPLMDGKYLPQLRELILHPSVYTHIYTCYVKMCYTFLINIFLSN